MLEGTADNPRFPHTLTVKRATVGTDGIPVTDNDGTPSYTTVLTSAFGYRDNGTSRTRGDVMETTVKLALPKTVIPILVNDIVEITDYAETYAAIVTDARTFNLGTNIWIRRPRN